MLHTIAADENTVCDNLNWRVKTFDSFRKKVMNVAEDYTRNMLFISLYMINAVPTNL